MYIYIDLCLFSIWHSLIIETCHTAFEFKGWRNNIVGRLLKRKIRQRLLGIIVAGLETAVRYTQIMTYFCTKSIGGLQRFLLYLINRVIDVQWSARIWASYNYTIPSYKGQTSSPCTWFGSQSSYAFYTNNKNSVFICDRKFECLIC